MGINSHKIAINLTILHWIVGDDYNRLKIKYNQNMCLIGYTLGNRTLDKEQTTQTPLQPVLYLARPEPARMWD